jgi:PAN domain
MRTVTTLLAAVLMLLPLPAHAVDAVDGVDMPGGDYSDFPAGSAFVCRNTCGAESRCQGWTWVKPGILGPTGHCWLKHTLPPLVKNDCCISGSRDDISARDLVAEDKTDRPGSDYKNFETDSWENCESTCAAEQLCSSWTYVQPGVQGPLGRCWLKDVVAHPIENQNTVAGVKFKIRMD